MYEESPRVKLLYKQFQGPLLGLGTDLSNLIKEGRILDAGCGIGDLVSELQRLNPETYGIDIESDMIDGIEGLAGAKQRVLYPDKVVGGDIAEPPFPNEYFDIIIMQDTIEPLHHPRQTLLAANRILKTNGILIKMKIKKI
mgnify:CR=1 FL=1